jgi:hypothetical protein
MYKENLPGTFALNGAARLKVSKTDRKRNSTLKSSSPQYAIACKVLRLNLEKIAEVDIRSAYGQFVQYPQVSEISPQLNEETVRGLEFIAGLDAVSLSFSPVDTSIQIVGTWMSFGRLDRSSFRLHSEILACAARAGRKVQSMALVELHCG